MADDFVPRREAELLTWAGAFDARINADPGAAGLDLSQAHQFHLDYLAFAQAYAAANDPVTRSPVNVASKNRLLGRLIFSIRQLSGIAQRFPGMTNPIRIALGLPPRSGTLTPIPAPPTAPLIQVRAVFGRTARLRVIDVARPTRRARPDGTDGLSVFSFIGTSAPVDLSGWTFEGNTGKTTMDVTFPGTVPAGATVWLTACWFNPRQQNGPLADPVSANLPGGSVSMAA